MNWRDLTLISAATLFGAAASATAIRLFFNPRKNNSASVTKTVVQRKSLSYNPFDPSKRTVYLSWDDYFMAIAFLSAERSKDPNRQVGACLVIQDGIILGIGYNGFPRGCSDASYHGQSYVCHAEVNAILNTNHATAVGQRLYVTMFPCNECAKIIIQYTVGHIYRECNQSTDLLTNIGCKEEKKCIYDSEHIPNRLSGSIRLDKLGFPNSGVSEVIYFVEKRSNNSETPYIASCKLLSMAGVKVRRHQPQMKQILLNFEEN